MSEAPDNHELDRRLAVLEERMNTMQADLSATLERFRADMAEMMRETASTNADTQKQIADTNADTQKQIATATERMATTRWWQTAILLGGMGIVAAVIIAAVA